VANADLPDDVRRLVETSIPTIEALEIMLLLARDPGQEWQPRAIPQLVHPSHVTEEQVREYLKLLASQGIMTTRDNGSFVFAPGRPELARAVEGLIVAYHQRPVTLIRTLYALADTRKVRSFADAFRLRKDP
jgi:hypothetical protein